MATGNSNPLRQAVDRAGLVTDHFRRIFQDVGVGVPGRGAIGAFYAATKVEISNAVKDRRYDLQRVNNAGRHLSRYVGDYSRSFLESMFANGVEEAAQQLAIYGFKSDSPTRAEENHMIDGSISYLTSVVDAQVSRMKTFALQGTPVEEIVGDDRHVGVLRDSEILTDLAALLIELFFFGFFGSANRSGDGITQIGKIAVAAIDNRTTQCCLHVHGQVQIPITKPFDTTYPPAWSDKQDAPPFHYYCRTAIALYLPQFDDGLAGNMREYARSVMNDPSRIKLPVSALSG